MKVYLVGGAVRDELLQCPITDRDWVVVGSTPDELIAQGYKPVGKDFPVFLHPQTKEEYALARTERKKGQGYQGFECHFAPEVTLEEDLIRRDLTINAIAKDPQTGELIDPHGGLKDLQEKKLRHVSSAFSEDPLRVLRVARFAAQLHHFGFSVHPETNRLMYQLARSGELETLSAERVWQELFKALNSNAPHIFLSILRNCGALEILFPEIHRLYGVPASTQWHPEIDSGIHLELVMKAVTSLSNETSIRFAALLHDLGKGITTRKKWPKHYQHDIKGTKLVKQFCERLRTPKEYTQLALAVCQYHGQLHQILDHPTPKATLGLLERLNAFRYTERLKQFCIACEADHRGRLGFENKAYTQASYLLAAFDACAEVDVQTIIEQGYEGAAIQQQIHKTRLKKLTDFCKLRN